MSTSVSFFQSELSGHALSTPTCTCLKRKLKTPLNSPTAGVGQVETQLNYELRRQGKRVQIRLYKSFRFIIIGDSSSLTKQSVE